MAALLVDMPVARVVASPGYPRFPHEFFEYAETFGHGVGVFFILTAVYALDAGRRAALPRMITCSLGAGLAANLGKLLVHRARPCEFDLAGGHVSQTFGHWLPLLSGQGLGHSFPSAHSAVAAGLATVLSHYYPRGRWYFALLALLCAIQRVQSGAHFLSDACFGALTGYVIARAILYCRRISAPFDRLEERAKTSGRGSAILP